MRTYTFKEVSRKIRVSGSRIKQWEKEFKGLLEIPRSKQGARLYTNSEINQLIEINQLYQKKLSSEEIRAILQEKQQPSTEENVEKQDQLLSIVIEKEIPSSQSNELAARSPENFFAAMDQYKQTFLDEVKNEITKVVQTEVIQEVKKEISKGALQAVKNISNSIYQSNGRTTEEIKELSYTIQKTTTESYKSLERKITEQSLETSEEFYTVAKQIAETSEELSHYIDATNNEISCLTETLERDREFYMEDRAQFRYEIRQRELAFQNMLASYRDAAPAKARKWWKFW